MSVWNTFDDTFWLTLAGIIVGLLGVLIRFCFLSKCENVSICCDFIKIHRAVELELPNVDEEIQNEEKDNIPTTS